MKRNKPPRVRMLASTVVPGETVLEGDAAIPGTLSIKAGTAVLSTTTLAQTEGREVAALDRKVLRDGELPYEVRDNIMNMVRVNACADMAVLQAKADLEKLKLQASNNIAAAQRAAAVNYLASVGGVVGLLMQAGYAAGALAPNVTPADLDRDVINSVARYTGSNY